ncbi:CHAD domain-containing protein [[Luteovulum] sphaeroides subsp. megalophilum]|uniref:CHAD domain-containing protein n=1 Tax=Cereibacter sphaeroides TaxID=1063 RepID=UPI000B6ABE07|nr:CHAD domain-containing protein [Cereibacter sphaeroides]SNT11472.1 CHAD domain-containing protein [[Luteovulum] sphaeroides subsp. megalophilum]
MARDDRGTGCETAEEAFRRIALECGEAFAASHARTMEEDDPEGPHKARVALRRLRSALAAFDQILDAGFARKTGRRARRLFRILGELRDADVLARHRTDGPEASAAAREADRMRRKVRKRLRRAEAETFAPKLARRLETRRWLRGNRRARALAAQPATRLGGRALSDAWAACLAHGGDLTAMSDEERHDMRKDLKTMRYTVEFFGELWAGKAQARFLGRMKALQDALGHLNDLAMLRREGALDMHHADAAREAMQTAGALWSQTAAAPIWWREGEGQARGETSPA